MGNDGAARAIVNAARLYICPRWIQARAACEPGRAWHAGVAWSICAVSPACGGGEVRLAVTPTPRGPGLATREAGICVLNSPRFLANKVAHGLLVELNVVVFARGQRGDVELLRPHIVQALTFRHGRFGQFGN